jgi:hypothetical protein
MQGGDASVPGLKYRCGATVSLSGFDAPSRSWAYATPHGFGPAPIWWGFRALSHNPRWSPDWLADRPVMAPFFEWVCVSSFQLVGEKSLMPRLRGSGPSSRAISNPNFEMVYAVSSPPPSATQSISRCDDCASAFSMPSKRRCPQTGSPATCLWRTRPAAPRTPAIDCTVVCLAMKPVGELDAGNRHVQFDERGWETGRWP